jgi:DNA-binding CsgD family transcriptional regulator
MKKYNILGLSPKEVELCLLITSGNTKKEIRDALGITTRTIHQHTYNISNKLGVNKDLIAHVIKYTNEYLSGGIND